MLLKNLLIKLSPNSLLKGLLLFLIHFYRLALSPYFGGSCRFSPSCSEYGLIALKEHNPLYATYLIVVRILKCRPLGPKGFDPVPSKCCHNEN